MSATNRRDAYRRTRRVAVGVGVAAVLTLVATEPGAAAPNAPATAAFTPGVGTAIALGYKVNPAFGNLSFGITAGESVAGHQNTAAQAQSKAVNLGVIGTTLAAEGCNGAPPTLADKDQPQPVIVSSDDPGAAEGKSGDEGNGAITMFSKATKAPFAEAITTVAPVGEPGVAVISGAVTTATSGVIAPGVREARAITDIGKLSLLGGAVVLGDMRWEAFQRSGAEKSEGGTFELGSLAVAGQKVAPPNDGLAQASLLADTLGALGFQIVPPAVRSEQGIVFVDPMKIGIIPSDLRDGVLGAVLSSAQPLRESFVEQVNRFGCGGDLSGVYVFPTSSAITVLDLAVGTISGAGSLNLELGGVQVSTADLQVFDFGSVPPLGSLPELPPADAPSLDSGTIADVGTPSQDLAAPPVSDAPPTTTGHSSEVAAPAAPIAAIEGVRGGALLAVGAGGLLLLLASAEGDRRKMRRALRQIPLEA